MKQWHEAKELQVTPKQTQLESDDISAKNNEKQEKSLRERHMAQPGGSNQYPQETWNKANHQLVLKIEK